MIPVARKRPPKKGREVAVRGADWLRRHKGDDQRPPPYWRDLRAELAAVFGQRCGYSAMYEPVGTVDHFLSIEGGHRHLAYTWANLRYASGWVNSAKGTLDDAVLDPHEVGDGWFELTLPSLQLVVTDKVPVRFRAKAKLTLERLHLDHGEAVIRQRQTWYELYKAGKASIELLEVMAPLLAGAIRRANSGEVQGGRTRRPKGGAAPRG